MKTHRVLEGPVSESKYLFGSCGKFVSETDYLQRELRLSPWSDSRFIGNCLHFVVFFFKCNSPYYYHSVSDWVQSFATQPENYIL